MSKRSSDLKRMWKAETGGQQELPFPLDSETKALIESATVEVYIGKSQPLWKGPLSALTVVPGGVGVELLSRRTPMRILILDDLKELHYLLEKRRFQGHTIVHAYTHGEAVAALSSEPVFDEVYLDHDLGQDACTGYDTAMFIACELAEEKRPGKVIVHTNDPSAASRMTDVLRKAGLDAEEEPFTV